MLNRRRLKAWRLHRRIRGWVNRALTQEVPFKVLSLLFALLIWAWVQTQQIVSQRTRAEVKWTIPEDQAWVDPVPKSLVVTIKGPQGLVRNVKKRTLRYDVDLSDAETGMTSVDFSERALKGMSEGVEVVQISPPGIDVELDQRMERTVRVTPATIGDVAQGYRLSSVSVSPSTVRIAGPRSLVRSIAEISTDVIDLTGLTANKELSLSLASKWRTVRPVEKQSLTANVTVEPIIAEKTFNDVPVMARADGWKTSPTTVVTLTGPAVVMRERRLTASAYRPTFLHRLPSVSRWWLPSIQRRPRRVWRWSARRSEREGHRHRPGQVQLDRVDDPIHTLWDRRRPRPGGRVAIDSAGAEHIGRGIGVDTGRSCVLDETRASGPLCRTPSRPE